MDGHVSEKTDTFAFGVVLLELLTGKPPYDHATATRLSSFPDDQLCEPATQLAPLLDARVPFASWAAGPAATAARWPAPRLSCASWRTGAWSSKRACAARCARRRPACTRSPPRGAELLVLPAATVAQIDIENISSRLYSHTTHNTTTRTTHNTQQQPTHIDNINKKTTPLTIPE